MTAHETSFRDILTPTKVHPPQLPLFHNVHWNVKIGLQMDKKFYFIPEIPFFNTF